MEPRYLSARTTDIDWNVLVGEPLKALLVQIIGFIPAVVTALLILLVGWLLSKLVMYLVRAFLEAIKTDKVAEGAGVGQMLRDSGVGMTPSQWVGAFVFWIGIFITWALAFNALHLDVLEHAAEQLVRFTGAVALAFATLVVGLLVSLVLGRLVETMARRWNAPQPALQAGVIKWAVIIFTFILAMHCLEFPSEFILALLAIVFVALGLAFVIAFGIGGRDWARKVLDRLA